MEAAALVLRLRRHTRADYALAVIMWGCLFFLAAVGAVAEGAGAGAARLVCYVEGGRATELQECTHLVYAGDARGDKLDALLKEYRKYNPRVKIVLRVDADKDLRTLLKSKHVQGLELHDAHKTLNRTKVLEAVDAARSAITSSGGGPLFLSLPAHPELLAKYYDLRVLMKKVDLMMVETHNLGAVKKMTYHPSRLSGLWDMMNTDSVVDLVVGLGVPASKVVITLPAMAQKFSLENETLSTPGSPTLEDDPKEIGQDELCRQLQKGRWTLERDQDLSAPYAFKDKTWISFEDASSVDVKGKYARVRGLAGLALYRAERDVDTPCGPTLKASLAKVLNQQSRAPRAAVLRSLEHEILSAPNHARALDALQVSPYRITQVVDSDGVIHSIREDTRTEFSCSRQGYFVHPRSCARFYRCVKFDQLSPEYTVFEFDCPAGLAFDSRYEVCVWPGSLADSQACPGSSEIAPVPKTRFICPEHEGYYADPENCRWFFACLDHGKAPLTAYEFRCPFGLGFDAAQLKCDWPWLVPACGNIARYEAEVHGFSAATLTGAAGFHGQTADAVNIAAHQSLASGASLNNLVGLQGGFLTHEDALDANFLASQELANGAEQYSQLNQEAGLSQGANILGHGSQGSNNLGLRGSELAYQVGDASSQIGNIGLVQPTQYHDEKKYTSGSLILDDYRLPTKKTSGHGHAALNGNARIIIGQGSASQLGYNGYSNGQGLSLSDAVGYSGTYSTSNLGQGAEGNNGYSTSSFSGNLGQKTVYLNRDSDSDNSGAYVHDPSGDYAEPYKHDDSPAVPYVHDSAGYKASSDYYDYNRYKGASQNYEGRYEDNSGQYVEDNSGAYVDSSSGHKATSSGAYVDSSAGYTATSNGYRADYSGASNGEYNGYKDTSQSGYEGKYVEDYSGQYTQDNSGAYVDSSAGYKTTSNGYRTDYSGSYNQDNSGQYEAGVYRVDGHIGSGAGTATTLNGQSYSQANIGNYISDSKAYTGSSHTLTAGAVNVGLVGKTTLVDADYAGQGSYQGQTGFTQSVSHQTLHPGHVSLISQPAVSINHVGTDENNLDGYGFVTTPTSSGIPTTATPYAVTTAIPAVTTYKTTFVPEAPKSNIKQIFGYSQPAVTFVQPTVVAVKQQYVTPNVQLPNYNQSLTNQYDSKDYSSGRYNGQQFLSHNSQTPGAKSESSGYDYSKPSIKFEDGISYTTSAPVTISTYKPQGFAHSQQTLHKVESVGFQYSTPTPVTEAPFRKAFAYTTGPSVTSFTHPTVSTYTPQAFSHQTIHKVEASNVNVPSVGLGAAGYTSEVSYEAPKIVQYSTVQPTIALQPVVSTYQPQVFSQQTLHKVEANRVNTYSQDSSSGYKYEKPAVKFEENAKSVFTYSTPAPTVVQYSTPAPAVVSTYRPQAYSHQTLHKFESKPLVSVSSTPLPAVQYEYQSTPVTVYQNPILKYTQPKVTPVTYVQSTYKPQAYSQQTIHKVENNKFYSSGDIGYEFTKPIAYEQPQTVTQYTTPQPTIAVQAVVSTYQPQVQSQQTLHKVDASQVNAYSEAESGYQYSKPAVKFEEAPINAFTYSTAAPAVDSTYKPYSQQTIHKVETQKILPVSSTVAPKLELSYQTADVSTYENPIIKYTQKVTPVTYVKPTTTVYSQTYQPTVQQHKVSHVQSGQYEGSSYEQSLQFNQEGYSYSQPEIQRGIETARKAYSDASLVSQQTFHLSNTQSESDSGKNVVFVSTTPATLAYEEHYSEYESPKAIYKAPEYVPPKTEYQQSYSVVSSAAPVVQQSYIQSQKQYDVEPLGYSQQYETVQQTVPVQQVLFSTSHQHVSQPKRIESYHISSFPGTKVTTKYQQASYDNPEIQVGYKAEEYIPSVVSTPAPVVTSTYRPRTYSTTTREYLPPTVSTTSTTREYLPPREPEYNAPEYLAPVVVNSYLQPSSTFRPRVKSTTPTYKYTESTTYKASEYLPPAERGSNVINFESFGFDNIKATAAPKIRYNPYQEINIAQEVTSAKPVYRKQNIVVETAKSNLLGFGTVGPDAGLVSPATYTTAAPIVSSTYTYRPVVKSTTQAPTYQYVESTTYKAPEYLPPVDEAELNIKSYGSRNAQQGSKARYQENVVVSTSAPIQRKQNIVVQTAKANQHAFDSVDSGAGLISQGYTASTPVFVSSSESYTVAPKRVTSTYTTEEQGLFEVSPSPTPRSRTKPKVAVVTKINDFNPLLVRKLGAVCSCQSPVLVLKGKRPNVPVPQDFDDYTNEYESPKRGDVSDDEWALKSARIQTPSVTTTPIVTSTFNPIIVPEDSYYQDYQELNNYDVTPKNAQIVLSSTPAVTSTQRVVRIRPRVKAVTVAPTYKTVLLNQEVEPSASSDEAASRDAAVSAIDSQSFDRYGPGGWRSRDETLQGSVDCKRAGLFRHPKQCNKFYACRWDCTKQRFTLHVFNCPVQLSFDPSIGACNWPSQGPACQGDTLLTNAL